MDKHILAMNYRCLNLQKITILCFFAYILKLPTIYNPPPMGWHFHSLEEYSHIAHRTKLLLMWNMGAWKLYDFNSELDVDVTNIQKAWKLTKIRIKLQEVSWWNRTFKILIIILLITVTLPYTSWHTKHHSPPHLPKKPLCISSQFLLLWIRAVVFVISGFHSEVDENCNFLRYYAVGIG
jgi:hypothetical protein